MQTTLTKAGFDPAAAADDGNRFFTGNGYMGVRGTVCEAKKAQLPAVNLAGIYHQKGAGWREPLNAPNPLYAAVSGASLAEAGKKPAAHEQTLDIACGLYARRTRFDAPAGALELRQERFCAMDDVHLLAQRVTLTSADDTAVTLVCGIDADVWDIHGPHYDAVDFSQEDGALLCRARTDDGQQVAVAWRCTLDLSSAARTGGLFTLTLPLQAGVPTAFDVAAAVYTTQDAADPLPPAKRAALGAPGYDALLVRQRAAWDALWADARVCIEGDPRAEFAVNYSLYHLMSIAPRHANSLSVPARGLSGQTYKGAIFWDTEMFMLDFFLGAMPQAARAALRYRIDTLPGALKKAASYGYAGAFYAWESQAGGEDGCSDYNVTDVFTHRPMRTYFKDRQIHISAAVVWALCEYAARTGDDSLLREGGSQMIWACAQFYLSYMTKRVTSTTYDLCGVVGPDEYHERVDNNAYTNEMARMTLLRALCVCPQYMRALPPEELAAFADAAERLKRPQIDDKTRVIEQFDGYFALEDATVDAVRSRLLDPREYWGGAYGVASGTQVIKQADVIAMLCLLGGFPQDVLAANYDYYEPRTEHGSSLSACMYALCACAIGRPEAAYPLFLKSAEADLQGGGKQWAGLVYIGGTHPAAAGGAYKVLLRGFLGASFDGEEIALSPCLPKTFKRVRMTVWHRGKRRVIDVQA